jgi:hypothetical protein
MEAFMLVTTTQELKIPVNLPTLQPWQLQRTVVHHLLHEGQIAMPDALSLLSAEDQVWLIEKLIDDVEKSLALAATIMDDPLRQHYWQQCNDLLGYLFHWHEHWSSYHSQLVSVLRTAVRRYPVQELTPERAKIMRRLTLRLHEERLYREDIFSATHVLCDAGWNTRLDLSPIAHELFISYVEELGRA